MWVFSCVCVSKKENGDRERERKNSMTDRSRCKEIVRNKGSVYMFEREREREISGRLIISRRNSKDLTRILSLSAPGERLGEGGTGDEG